MNNITYKNLNYSLENDPSFTELYQLTLDACSLERFPDGVFNERGNVWKELTDSWNSLLSCGSAGIFLEAVHRIMWNIPSKYNRPQYERIVEATIKELESDGEAFAVWDSYESFKTVYKIIVGSIIPSTKEEVHLYHSVTHCIFIRDKTAWKIRYSKTNYREAEENLQKDITSYTDAIKKIVPTAASWSEEYWYDENHILDEIHKLYGIDYRDHIDDYDKLLQMLINSDRIELKDSVKEAWFACNISTLPYSLAQVIWPVRTKNKIIKMMRLAIEEVKLSDAEISQGYKKSDRFLIVGDFERSKLFESWIYKLLNTWVYDTTVNIKFKEKVRELVFNFNFAI